MRRESSQPVLLSTVALFPMWEIIRPGGAEVSASRNTLPPLPDDLIDAVSQLNSDEGSIQWAMGDLLAAAVDEMGPVYATHPGIGSLRRGAAQLFRKKSDPPGLGDRIA